MTAGILFEVFVTVCHSRNLNLAFNIELCKKLYAYMVCTFAWHQYWPSCGLDLDPVLPNRACCFTNGLSVLKLGVLCSLLSTGSCSSWQKDVLQYSLRWRSAKAAFDLDMTPRKTVRKVGCFDCLNSLVIRALEIQLEIHGFNPWPLGWFVERKCLLHLFWVEKWLV